MPLRLHAAETASIGVPDNLRLPAPDNLGLSIGGIFYLHTRPLQPERDARPACAPVHAGPAAEAAAGGVGVGLGEDARAG